MKIKLPGTFFAAGALLTLDLAGTQFSPYSPSLTFMGEAQAAVGRPLTPGSVAGTARRTTRRVVRRSTTYIARLPAGCVATPINGVRYWRCGGTYYATSGNQYVVVYIN